ncbi:MAG: OmpA family protein [Bacteroidota bacterium]
MRTGTASGSLRGWLLLFWIVAGAHWGAAQPDQPQIEASIAPRTDRRVQSRWIAEKYFRFANLVRRASQRGNIAPERATFLAGIAYYNLGWFDVSLLQFERLVREAPRNPYHQLWYTRLLQINGHPSAALIHALEMEKQCKAPGADAIPVRNQLVQEAVNQELPDFIATQTQHPQAIFRRQPLPFNEPYQEINAVPFRGGWLVSANYYFFTLSPVFDPLAPPPSPMDIWWITGDSTEENFRTRRLPPPVNSRKNELIMDTQGDSAIFFIRYKFANAPTSSAKWHSEALVATPNRKDRFKTIRRLSLWPDTLPVIQFSLSPAQDRAVLAVASPRDNGDSDLYLTRRDAQGDWSPPRPLGPVINSAGNEVFPRFDRQGGLLFASDGHPGYGGYDIFHVQLDSPALPPHNLGWGINSPLHEMSYFPLDPDTGYLAAIPGGEQALRLNFDIWRATRIPPLPDSLATRRLTRDELPAVHRDLSALAYFCTPPPREVQDDCIEFFSDLPGLDSIPCRWNFSDGSAYTSAAVTKCLTGDQDSLVGTFGYFDAQTGEWYTSYPVTAYREKARNAFARIERPDSIVAGKPFELSLAGHEGGRLFLENVHWTAPDGSVQRGQTAEIVITDPRDNFILWEISGIGDKGELVRYCKTDTLPVVVLGPTFVDTLHFDFDIARPNSAYQAVVERIKAKMNSDRGYFLEIHGHTDDFGSEAYNYALGQRRARTIQQRLIANRVDRERVRIFSFGETRPIAPNDSPRRRANNRRVEFHYYAARPPHWSANPREK